MKPFVYTIAVATMLLSLSACDSRHEEQRKASLENKADNLEDRADMVRDSGEKKADKIEQRDPGLNSQATKDAASAARKDSENKADSLENEADQVRDNK